LQGLILQSLVNDGTAQLGCSSCQRTLPLSSPSQFASFGSILVCNIVWEQAFSDSDARPANWVEFTIDHDLVIPVTRPGSTTVKTEWHLSGAIVKRGFTIDSGHYVASIRESGQWWELDDHHIRPMATIQHLFAGDRTPVLLFYTRAEWPSSQPSLLPEDEAMARYSSVSWAAQQVINTGLVTAIREDHAEAGCKYFERLAEAMISLQPPPAEQLKLCMFGTTTALTPSYIKSRLISETSWWSDALFPTVVSAAESIIEVDTNPRPAARYAESYLWNDMEPRVPNLKRSTLPFTALGQDIRWHNIITVSVIPLSPQAHFATVAIIGPSKLVVFFDGMGGSFKDSRAIEVGYPPCFMAISMLTTAIDNHQMVGHSTSSGDEK
jgi:hypothetical protein